MELKPKGTPGRKPSGEPRMIRRTFWLRPDQIERLEQLPDSQSEFIRAAVDAAFQQQTLTAGDGKN
jgi:hypothetical protein